MIVLYHRTSADAAKAILRDGFKDDEGTYLTDTVHRGVWFSIEPLDANEGACGDVLLSITVNMTWDKLAEYEWVEEGNPIREFFVPAAIANKCGIVSVVKNEDDIPTRFDRQTQT